MGGIAYLGVFGRSDTLYQVSSVLPQGAFYFIFTRPESF
jgi:hypothetical protein